MPWSGAYTASNKHLGIEKAAAIREYRFFVLIHCGESWVFRHSYTYTARTRGNHAWIQDDNDGTRCECMTNYSFTHVSFVQNVNHVRFFRSRSREFLNLQNVC